MRRQTGDRHLAQLPICLNLSNIIEQILRKQVFLEKAHLSLLQLLIAEVRFV